MAGYGKILLVIGVVIALLGVLFIFGDRLGLGRLPGDLTFRSRTTTFHFPIVTSIIVSIVLTVLLNLWFRR